jgi:hypothetical protein
MGIEPGRTEDTTVHDAATRRKATNARSVPGNGLPVGNRSRMATTEQISTDASPPVASASAAADAS